MPPPATAAPTATSAQGCAASRPEEAPGLPESRPDNAPRPSKTVAVPLPPRHAAVSAATPVKQQCLPVLSPSLSGASGVFRCNESLRLFVQGEREAPSSGRRPLPCSPAAGPIRRPPRLACGCGCRGAVLKRDGPGDSWGRLHRLSRRSVSPRLRPPERLPHQQQHRLEGKNPLSPPGKGREEPRPPEGPATWDSVRRQRGRQGGEEGSCASRGLSPSSGPGESPGRGCRRGMPEPSPPLAPAPGRKRSRPSDALPARPFSAAVMLLSLALLLVVLLRCPHGGCAAALRPSPFPGASSSPTPKAASSHRPLTPPDAPQRLHFQAHTFQHLLHWTPGSRASQGLLYDVQYKQYGYHSWMPLAHCTAIASLFCDLTDETAEPSGRYFARVRAVSPDGTSPWTRSGSFSPKEATLQLRNMSLALSGNILRVTLDLPVHRGKDAAAVAYEDLHPDAAGWGRYLVYVRRASSNDTEYKRLETNRTFELPPLQWGERYCVSVEPLLPSRPNPANRTAEQCISTPPPTGHPRATVILSFALLGLAAPGLVAVASWVRAYVKKPVETPSVLKTFRKQAPPWLHSEPRPPGMSKGGLVLEAEPTHQLSLELKTHPEPAHVSQPKRTARHVLEEVGSQVPEAFSTSSSRTERPRWLRGPVDSSGCSADSGICLQEPLGSHGFLHAEGSIQEDHGLEREEDLLQDTPPATSAQPGRPGSEQALKQADLLHAQASGYQRQEGGPVDVLGSSNCLPIFEGMAQPKLILPSGYLKQASVAFRSAPGCLAVAPGAGLGASMGSTHHGRLHCLPSVAPGDTEAFLPCLPELPKALRASSRLEQDPVWPLPHLSLLHSNAHLNLSLPWGRV